MIQKKQLIRFYKWLKSNSITAVTGEIINIEADSICVHGDNLKALEFVTSIRHQLQISGIEIKSLKD